MPIAFWYMTLLLTTFIFGVELDVGHTLTAKTELQGAVDASTLAGTQQNHLVVNANDQYGAPINYEFKLNDDSGPEDKAWETWQKNLQNMTMGIGQGAYITFQRTPDNKGIWGFTQQDVSLEATKRVMEGWFGKGSAPDSTVPVQARSVSKVFP
jgi:hypothetical protein